VSSNVSPEEVEALLDDENSSTAQSVALRDFRQPHRLSRVQQTSIRSSVSQRLLDIEQELRVWLRDDYPIELLDIGETNAIGLFENLEDPIVVFTVDVGGVSGWVVWENPAALSTVAVAMGCEPPEQAEKRGLTPLEAGLIGDILLGMTRQIGDALGLQIGAGKMSMDVRTFLIQLDPDDTIDPQRLFLHLGLNGPGGESTIRIYLPGLLPDKAVPPGERAVQLPKHLDQVPVEVSAQLGTLEVPLQDLMKVEAGDVIPLDLTVGDPLEILIEGKPSGHASWGNCRGRLGIRIEHLEPERETNPS
jgi:flagellar motor switch protein FliM